MAARGLSSNATDLVALAGSLRPKARGSMIRAISERATNAPCQSNQVSSPKLIGSIMNCPKEPTDMAIPIARDLCSGFTKRLMVPKITGNVVPDKPTPMNIPAPIMKSVLLKGAACSFSMTGS